MSTGMLRAALASAGMAAGLSAGGEELPLNEPVPEFRLVDQAGAERGREAFAGKVWVAGFFFTRCPGPCLALTRNMAHIQTALADEPDIRLASFTIDPEADRPEVLAAYMRRHGASPRNWFFLTGEPTAVRALVRKGFQQYLIETSDPGAGGFVHSTRLALVDRAARMRNHYDGLDGASVAQLIRDARALARSPAPPRAADGGFAVLRSSAVNPTKTPERNP